MRFAGSHLTLLGELSVGRSSLESASTWPVIHSIAARFDVHPISLKLMFNAKKPIKTGHCGDVVPPNWLCRPSRFLQVGDPPLGGYLLLFKASPSHLGLLKSFLRAGAMDIAADSCCTCQCARYASRVPG